MAILTVAQVCHDIMPLGVLKFYTGKAWDSGSGMYRKWIEYLISLGPLGKVLAVVVDPAPNGYPGVGLKSTSW